MQRYNKYVAALFSMENLLSHFTNVFGASDEKPLECFAPGRINLIGEHIDYNGGPVMPFAIENGTHMLLRENNIMQNRLFSMNFPDRVFSVPVSHKYSKQGELWINYPLGSMQMMIDSGLEIDRGFDILYYGDIPNGAGMSSSASIEVVTIFGFNQYFKFGLSLMAIVKLAKKAENIFVGLSCGIMDQYSVAFGKKNHAIHLNCDIPDHRYIEVNMQNYEFVAVNTCRKRGLTDSKYNERFSESMKSLKILKNRFKINNLCELNASDLSVVEEILKDKPLLWKRTRHVISEKERVLKAEKALISGDAHGLGLLMNESHRSLQYDYESTGLELDTIVSILQTIDGVAGARVTGGGFGGCAIALAKKGVIWQEKDVIIDNYRSVTGLTPEFYAVAPSEGVRLTGC